jgi:hypothetical protein
MLAKAALISSRVKVSSGSIAFALPLRVFFEGDVGEERIRRTLELVESLLLGRLAFRFGTPSASEFDDSSASSEVECMPPTVDFPFRGRPGPRLTDSILLVVAARFLDPGDTRGGDTVLGGRPLRRIVDGSLDEILSKSKLSPLLLLLLLLLLDAFFLVVFLSTDFLRDEREGDRSRCFLVLFFFTLKAWSAPFNSSSSET